MTEYIILMPLAILILGLAPIVARDNYLNKSQKNIMFAIIALIGVLVLQNVADYILQTVVFAPFIRTLVSIVGYAVRPIIIVLFCKLVRPKEKNTVAWILVAVNAAVYLTAIFSHVPFYIDENNHFRVGILYFSKTAFAVSFILLCHLIYCTVREYSKKKAWIWIPIVNILLIVVASILDISPLYKDYPVSNLTIFIVCCSLFYYIWLHLEFVKEHERDLKAEQRIKIMMSQIQPHFLYNTLTTIQSLCLIDPQKASEVTGKFGAYLRNNLDSLEQENLIPFSKELEYTKLYVDIEMLRFPEISVEYNIGAEDFLVPALTIQPLVENAIRHGVREVEQGKVKVSTKQTDDGNIIIISDNGVGFDTNIPYSTDKDHIGIKNVSERIKALCGGTIGIDSKISEGTVITIKIPRESE